MTYFLRSGSDVASSLVQVDISALQFIAILRWVTWKKPKVRGVMDFDIWFLEGFFGGISEFCGDLLDGF